MGEVTTNADRPSISLPISLQIRERFDDIGEGQLRSLECGPSSGPLVLLLHGFPACAAKWRVRGYGKSFRPTEVAAYSVTRVVADLVALVAKLSSETAFVVGHDFGGGVAWAMAMFAPERVTRLAILNAVHPVGFERQMRHLSQLEKSWYLFFFQIAWLPEWLLGRNDFAFLLVSRELS